MTTGWYYAHDEKKLGPFSPREFKELADAGTILPLDTVWQEGVEKGVPASRVRNLFPRPAATLSVAASPAPVIASESALAQLVAAETPFAPPEKPAPPKTQPRPQPAPPKKGRAVAVKGADIVGQDGLTARYRKKCTKCGHKDAACHMVTIANKLIKGNFYCPKCKKGREVSIQCTLQ